MTPTHRRLPDGRWHFRHGPIDLIVLAEGPAAGDAVDDLARWFGHVLAALVAELPMLKAAVDPRGDCPFRDPIARAMWRACLPFAQSFITPLAAVAGAVADAAISLFDRPGIDRAAVNNGGDIALYLRDGASLRLGIVTDPTQALESPKGGLTIDSAAAWRGVATSGWRGRSFSLGIADSVTVLAATAAQADAAATVIANAVDCDAPGIRRAPASSLKDDSDLGDIPVTVEVPRLTESDIATALAAGARCAEQLLARGLIGGAALSLQGNWSIVGAAARRAMTAPPVAA